ncbi:MAG: glutathione S-transferase family protein [Myxococcales bacterium]|nr:glutathione S-transferase family protein [Myxococcales bacterium]
MIKIYGSPKSSAARCYWALEEAGVAYESVRLSFSDKEHKAPEYLALNPHGKVPTLVDGDLVLWESLAINRYLVGRYAPTLLGDGEQERAHVDQWSIWSQVDLQPPVIRLFIQMVFVPEERRDSAVMDKARAKFRPMLETLDRHLVGKDHVVGDTFTLADLNVASVARLLPDLDVDLTPFVHLSGWLEKTLARPARQRVVALG